MQYDSILSVGDCGFLKGMPAQALLEMNSIASFSQFKGGSMLFAEGQSRDEVFILLEGRIKLFIGQDPRERVTIEIAEPGAILGLISFSTNSVHVMNAKTCCLCHMASIDCTAFNGFLAAYPSVWQSVLRVLAKSYDSERNCVRRLGCIAPVTAKLAQLILSWCGEGTPTQCGIELNCDLRHTEIAECIGSRRESVSRILKAFKRQKIIEQEGSRWTIANRSALQQYADGTPASKRSLRKSAAVKSF
jgi:CRP/FNR family transcriptional regulator